MSNNRIIKFRAWDIKWKKFRDGNQCFAIGRLGESAIKADFILMQSTGLKDKFGKEIYEGDLLLDEMNQEIHKIIFDEYEARFEAIFGSGLKRHIPDVKIMKIIGNIYENPELLK